MTQTTPRFESRSLLTFSDAVYGQLFVVGVSAGALTWDRPVMIRGIFLSSSFVGNSTISVATSRGEVFASRTNGNIQSFDSGTSNLIPGTTLVAGANAFQRTMDNILLAQSFSYVTAGTALAKWSGVAWDQKESWVLGEDQAITCFQSGDFTNNVLRTIMTVHFNYIPCNHGEY